jgi:N-acetylglucosamine-6-phosphate deacetylase
MVIDGAHVHDALTRLVARAVPDRLALITDAVSAAGADDGRYPLGDRELVVRNGIARLAGSTGLAGSTLTMDQAVRRFVRDLGLPVTVAAAAAATTPARLLGIADRCGSIAAGLDADLVHLGDDLILRRVMSSGAWVTS